MKYIVKLTIGIIAIFGFGIFFYFKKNVKFGKVIILNGPSVSGKSSIQKEFQQIMLPNLFIKLGIDNLFDKPMPDINMENLEFWQKENSIRWVETKKDKDANSLVILFTGKEGDKVAFGMNSAILEYAKNGCNIIVDYIAYKKEWLNDLKKKLKGVDVYWVKIDLPINILEDRELKRGTSPKGHARSHYNLIHWDLKYNLEIDSSEYSAKDIAIMIKNELKL